MTWLETTLPPSFVNAFSSGGTNPCELAELSKMSDAADKLGIPQLP